ncbi:hypothetical protein BGX38DRAFT_1208563 [Terfezia claveryi]|nr:hypothetical protein BGX38DRAFT_1208563 [Terfezia claveryi]
MGTVCWYRPVLLLQCWPGVGGGGCTELFLWRVPGQDQRSHGRHGRTRKGGRSGGRKGAGIQGSGGRGGPAVSFDEGDRTQQPGGGGRRLGPLEGLQLPSHQQPILKKEIHKIQGRSAPRPLDVSASC